MNKMYSMTSGAVDFHEYLKLDCCAKKPEMMMYLKNHLTAIFDMLDMSIEGGRDASMDMTLVLNNDEVYCSQRRGEFMAAVQEKLPLAHSVCVDCNARDIYTMFCLQDETFCAPLMAETVDAFEGAEDFTFKSFVYYHSSGEYAYQLFENGRRVDYKEKFSENILKERVNGGWHGEDVGLIIWFDFQKHADVLKSLRNVACKYLPAEEFENSAELWDDPDEDDGILVNANYWQVDSLQPIQAFADELNAVLAPIMDEVTVKVEDYGWNCFESFALANWVWTENGFQVMGVKF